VVKRRGQAVEWGKCPDLLISGVPLFAALTKARSTY
jgi:hypothetical protein